MLAFVEGDLFESPSQTLVNAVDTAGIMGKGIAAEFERRFPDMFLDYRRPYEGTGMWISNVPHRVPGVLHPELTAVVRVAIGSQAVFDSAARKRSASRPR